MPDTFLITIIFIVLTTIIGAFLKGRAKDRCLVSFSGYPVVLEKDDGKLIWGNLIIENSGLELLYEEPYHKDNNRIHKSYILFKNEYPKINIVVRYLD